MIIKPNSLYLKVYLDQEGKCKWCTEPCSVEKITRDHLFPKSKGYRIRVIDNKLLNLILACPNCNNLKGDLTIDEFQVLIEKKRDKYGKRAPQYSIILDSILSIKKQIELIPNFINLITK